MTPLLLRSQIHALELAHAALPLMQRAGAAIAAYVRQIALPGSRLLVLAGPGNNGGDALVAASLLHHDYVLNVVMFGDPQRLPDQAAQACRDWQASGGELHTALPVLGDTPGYALVLDGLFGIGLARPLQGGAAALVQQVNALGVPVLALDVPSGLCADTGAVLGVAIQARYTLTFLAHKPGLYTHDGPDHAGRVQLARLDVPGPDVADLVAGDAGVAGYGHLLDAPGELHALKRRLNSNKGNHGRVAVIGGAGGMMGAALLAARAALLCGAGRVYAGLLDAQAYGLDYLYPELMLRDPLPLTEVDAADCVVLGPGLGQGDLALYLLEAALRLPAPLVLDADALNLMACTPTCAEQSCARSAATIITPHPGEAARLLACSVAEVQQDRIGSAIRLAQQYAAITVLKGCGSVIATPAGHWWINRSGNPGLASAGMGDVLAGIIAALLVQGLQPQQSVLTAVHLHGAAADGLVASGIGPLGLTASEVGLQARRILNLWLARADAS
ncbi:NAD(P)H-hydrate dehydratase [Pseudomethylobacillus aquaticus]|uniref:Bifunctional NAD(P)H-hydrate repair enzyme n=1 Tax=Pseudomethylobacillus aquaticus TaxID=2676064 RepID=A0A3N0UYC3_9PROT|nr:NAD(P)H-hydrate dehydratase [Pseudomethylobacillus aquaticus]ROH85537.1 NAD(P)H-hydrate dehydratase [Pseudomethylobacillus aquaticus]